MGKQGVQIILRFALGSLSPQNDADIVTEFPFVFLGNLDDAIFDFGFELHGYHSTPRFHYNAIRRQ